MSDAARVTSIRVDEVRQRFAEWRRTCAKKARIPDELWDAAVAVALFNELEEHLRQSTTCSTRLLESVLNIALQDPVEVFAGDGSRSMLIADGWQSVAQASS